MGSPMPKTCRPFYLALKYTCILGNQLANRNLHGICTCTCRSCCPIVFFLCLLGSTSLLVIFDRHFEFVQPTCQGAYLLATLMHNWHRPLYTRRGGKRIIKVPQLFYDQKHSFNKNNCHHIQTWLQDWASTQATQTRAVLGHLHTLARKSVSSRHRKGWVDEFLDVHTGIVFWSLPMWCRNQKIHVLKTLYLRLTGKQVWWLHWENKQETCDKTFQCLQEDTLPAEPTVAPEEAVWLWNFNGFIC